MSTPKLSNERALVQQPILDWAQAVGWEYLSPEEAKRLRRGDHGRVLWEVLNQQLVKLNAGVLDHNLADEVIRKLLRERSDIEGNQAVWEWLRGRRTIFVPGERRERNVTVLDLEHWGRNTYHITEEWRYSNGTWKIRPDIVFLINGLPVLVVEAKAATKPSGKEEALDQIQRYHERAPELMGLFQLHAPAQLPNLWYGPTWQVSQKATFNWRDELEPRADFETLVRSFCRPELMLRLVTDYVLFTRRDGELQKLVLRPHQVRAVDKVVRRAGESSRRALVWHTQGSGKTYTMLTAARIILDTPAFENPTVLMLIDRTELQDQLLTNLAGLGFGEFQVAASKADLEERLAKDERGLLVSMIHKFEDTPADLNARSNIFVLIDEAHRTTGGDLGTRLMAALPNATLIGFTGTPIDRSQHGQGTFTTFATEGERYLDRYSIRESIGDGTTVPLHYALAPNELRIDRDVLEQHFLRLTELEGVSEVEDLNRVLDRAVTLKNMLKSPQRIERVAAHIANHFTETVQPMGFKAFVVAVDREACCLYKAALDRLLPAEWSQVVISGTPADPVEMQQFHLSDSAEDQIRRAFRKQSEDPQILIVTEKLLTGFDAPVLYCMYLDKPMRDHVLLQAIARVNRPYEDEDGRPKPAGFVLDYVGIFERLEAALAFDSAEIGEVVEDLGVLERRYADKMAVARRDHLPVTAGLSDVAMAEAVLTAYFDEEPRYAFYRLYRELEELHEILSPSAFLRPFLDDFATLGSMYLLLRQAHDPRPGVDRSLLRKTAALVRQQTQVGEVMDPERIFRIEAEALDQLGGAEASNVSVFSMLRRIREEVARAGADAPHLIPIGDRADAIIEAFRERQLDTAQALEQLRQQIEIALQAERERLESDLPRDAFAVQFILTHVCGVPNADEVAAVIRTALDECPHWRDQERHERELRMRFYRALNGRVDNMPEVVNQVLDALRRTDTEAGPGDEGRATG